MLKWMMLSTALFSPHDPPISARGPVANVDVLDLISIWMFLDTN